MKRGRQVAVTAILALFLVVMATATTGCFGPPAADFELVESARYTIDGADQGNEGWCIADIEYDDVGEEVWLLDYDNGVHRFSVDGVHLGSEAPAGVWEELSLHRMAALGDGAGMLLTGSVDGTGHRMNLGDAGPEPFFGELLNDAPLTVDASRRLAFAAPAEGDLEVYDIDTGDRVADLPTEGRIRALAYSPDDDLLYTVSPLGNVSAVDPNTGAVFATGLGPSVEGLTYDADRGVFYSVNFSLEFRYRVKTLELVWN